MDKKKSFLERLKDAYENMKKELAMTIVFVALLVDVLPSELFPGNSIESIQIGLIFTLSLIILEVVFDIYARVKDSNKRIKIIKSNDLLENIHRLVDTDRSVEIDYVAIAGRHGWSTVLAKFLDPENELCLLNKREVTVRIALVSDAVLDQLGDGKTRYSTVDAIIEEIEFAKKKLAREGYQNVKIDIYRYDHLPNFIGFLVNANYLFTAMSYWETQDNKPANLRGGGTDYLVYDKNDGFGGAFFVKRFEGWFSYAAREENKRLSPLDSASDAMNSP